MTPHGNGGVGFGGSLQDQMSQAQNLGAFVPPRTEEELKARLASQGATIGGIQSANPAPSIPHTLIGFVHRLELLIEAAAAVEERAHKLEIALTGSGAPQMERGEAPRPDGGFAPVLHHGADLLGERLDSAMGALTRIAAQVEP